MSADERGWGLRARLKQVVKDRILGGTPGREADPSPRAATPPPPPAPVATAEATATPEAPAADPQEAHASLLSPLRLLAPAEDAVHAARVIEAVAAAVPTARFSARVPPGGRGRRYLFVEIPGGRGAREALASASEAAREAGSPALLGFADAYRPGDPGAASSDAPGPGVDRLRLGSRAAAADGGSAPGVAPEEEREIDLAGWPLHGVREIVGALPLLENRLPEPSSRAWVRLPAVMLRGAVVRLSQARVTCRAAAIRVDRFAGHAHLRDQVLLAVEDHGGSPLPEHLLEALARLAGAAVYRPAEGSGGDRFLVQRGWRLPISGSTLSGLLAETELHLFGGPGDGHLVLDEVPDFRPVAIPALAEAPGPAERVQAGPAGPIPGVAVRLVPRPPGPAPAEALLLSERELGWLVRLLPHLPGRWMERLQVVRGRDVSLLVCDGPLPPSLPFGVPLRRRDPPTLLVEAHHDLDPDLDRESLRVVAGLEEGTLEAWLPGRRLRFPVSAVRPAADLVAVDPGLVPEGVTPLDEGFSWKLEQSRGDAGGGEGETAEATPGGISLDGRRALLADAAKLAAAGQFSEAAAIHERMGEYGKAARLYERAAEDEERRRARRRA